MTNKSLKAQAGIVNSLDERVATAGAETRLLPPPPPVVAKAIESGRSAVTEAVAQGIESIENPIVAAESGVRTFSFSLFYQSLTSIFA